ncbi:hypothetical protein [Motiliproteus sp. SC1-56]|uniref:hypothetical protein n=1 Tax=Motiliproteus sp. SC1-56 TaxID=2799565 RepID=UPI001A8EFBE7|nr:hypothetical protein [Motiliproteus sp. SC1-56]
MQYLPKFILKEYESLISAFDHCGFKMRPSSHIDEEENEVVYFRHDVDFSIDLSLPIAELEAKLGVSSVYYILLTGPYNALSKSSICSIKKLIDLGHKIGLHYDLSCYPGDLCEARNRLSVEVGLLELISDSKVASIVMHEPFRGGGDIFLEGSGYSNPSYNQYNDPSLCYVSDSCRAWRDDTLLRFLSGLERRNRLLLNTHPELWLAKRSMHRLSYLNDLLGPKILKPKKDYFLRDVKNIWSTHEAAVNGYGDVDEL